MKLRKLLAQMAKIAPQGDDQLAPTIIAVFSDGSGCIGLRDAKEWGIQRRHSWLHADDAPEIIKTFLKSETPGGADGSRTG